MHWLLNFAYAILLLLASPVLLYRALFRGKYRDGWAEKLLGRLPIPTGSNPRIWFHAVSVGEVLQLETVVAELSQRRPDVEIIVTTTTATGLAVARAKFPRHRTCYFPLDFSWAARAALRRLRPDAVVLVELELWPNFIREVHRRGIPLLLINGRIGEKSFRGYRRVRWLMRRVLRCFDALAVQNETYAERLRQLGAPLERVTVTGSIKFDRVQTDRDNPGTRALREAFGLRPGETVFLAGSTHAPEEEFAIETCQALRGEFPDLRLLLVPRHRERFEEVARLVASRGLALLRRSEAGGQRPAFHRDPAGERMAADFGSRRSEVGGRRPEIGGRRSEDGGHNDHSPTPQSPVLLLDTLGELSACWGLADVAFVGGSLTGRGGQNMIEPAAYGAAVLFGPNTRNFRDVVELLLDGEAARVVGDAGELTRSVRQLLRDPQAASELGRRAQRLVLSQQGAAARTVALIAAALPAAIGTPPEGRSAA